MRRGEQTQRHHVLDLSLWNQYILFISFLLLEGIRHVFVQCSLHPPTTILFSKNESFSSSSSFMSIIKLLFKNKVIDEVVVPTTCYATAVKKFQDVVASSIVPAMTNARLVLTELSNTLIVSTSNKVTATVEFARDIASSIESKMPDFSRSAVVTLVKEQHTIFLVLTSLLFALLAVLLIRYMPSDGFMSSGASQKKKKKNESVHVIKKIHSMVTIDTTATSSSSISNSSIAESSTREEDADTDYEDGVCFIDDDASCTSEIVRECIGEPSMISLRTRFVVERASPMRKLSRKLSSSN